MTFALSLEGRQCAHRTKGGSEEGKGTAYGKAERHKRATNVRGTQELIGILRAQPMRNWWNTILNRIQTSGAKDDIHPRRYTWYRREKNWRSDEDLKTRALTLTLSNLSSLPSPVKQRQGLFTRLCVSPSEQCTNTSAGITENFFPEQGQARERKEYFAKTAQNK